ncbi:MAG: hypothetical protein LBV79_05015 [Candidatus Adiutrix sp.]|nr:hypothetical protein [Candidatus Adiutrix sp.]
MSKPHMQCDALGNPMKFIVTLGRPVITLRQKLLLENIEGQHVLTDKGYDSNLIVETVASIAAEATIPPRANRQMPREYDVGLYVVLSNDSFNSEV